MASPTTAYMAHGCSVQWNRVVAIAVSMAWADSASGVSGGGATKCDSGSLTPKNISPMPMPALNIIATQETVRNSGASSSRPRGIRPYLPAASQSTKRTKAEARSTNSQPRLVSTHSRAVALADPRPSGVAKPQATKARATTAETPKTTRSSDPPRSAGDGGGSATAGWASADPDGLGCAGVVVTGVRGAGLGAPPSLVRRRPPTAPGRRRQPVHGRDAVGRGRVRPDLGEKIGRASGR